MKRYNIINNSLGWLCFVIAAVSYLLTIEPTASFWDCPEFIAQGFKLEVGHPPGNPIFMLTARFFVTLFGGGAQTAAIAVNSMSALLSAATILLLFWTITHLVRKLIVRDDAQDISWLKTAIIMGAGFCGAMMYAWSDTFWFSAVEGEVYAFSSFCTALVFWLILKWENRADKPHSDRYLVLIAYIIGISIAVHLLNLLCIPAIVLVFYYRKFRNTNLVGSLIALGVSVVIIALILYGLVPGIIGMAQGFELFFVNTLGFSYNIGVLVYAILLVAVLIWAVHSLYRQDSPNKIRWSIFLAVFLSGILYIAHSVAILILLTCALGFYIFFLCKKIPVRIFNVIILSIFVIFIGYSSYALLLIRANADTPMNQNAPDNVFALSSYLNREQYGDRPLFSGPVFAEEINWHSEQTAEGETIRYAAVKENGYPEIKNQRGLMMRNGEAIDNGEDVYTKVVKKSPDQPDQYVKKEHNSNYEYSKDISMFFTRMYSSAPMHVDSYKTWAGYENPDLGNIPQSVRKEWADRGYVLESEINPYLEHQKAINLGTDEYGDPNITYGWVADFGTNLRYFINYQLNHMYWRYFMWNFAGRQNDIQSQGEPYAGNWISGIPVIDNARLGDQSLLPDEYDKDNAGHNVFFMLPLLMGIFGLLWQALKTHRYASSRGIEQFWVVFFLFFMTGIAIVLYLNQPPGQPRERDYAFAGSFYAFAIWVGMGVPAIAWALKALFAKYTVKDSAPAPKTDTKALTKDEKADANRRHLEHVWTMQDRLSDGLKWTAAGIAVLIGIIVPLQVVSQTWDDHDRSGRYTTRDFGMNYLNSLDKNAIIFVNGDNDTFPLWYAQEVEGCRTDVKVVNLSYLSTDWYANQIRSASYQAKGTPMFARPTDYAYNSLQYINWSAEDIYNLLASDALDPEHPLAMRYNLYPIPADYAGCQTLSMQFKAKAQAASQPVNIDKAMKDFYNGTVPAGDIVKKMYPELQPFTYPNVYTSLDPDAIARCFGRRPAADSLGNTIMQLGAARIGSDQGRFNGILNDWLVYDIISRSAKDNFKRPVYFASTVGPSFYPGWENSAYVTGMAYQITPFERQEGSTSPVAAKAYNNIVGKFRWGGLDTARPGHLYLDETVRSMVASTRRIILESAKELMEYGNTPAPESSRKISKQNGLPIPRTYVDMAQNLVELMQKKLPTSVCPMMKGVDIMLAEYYIRLGILNRSKALIAKGRKILDEAIVRNGEFIRYYNSLDDTNRQKVNSIERQNMSYNLPQIAAAINIADIAEAIITSPKASEITQTEHLNALAKITDGMTNLNVILYTFAEPYDAGLDHQLSTDPRTAPYYNTIRNFNRMYGLSVDKARKDVVRKAGITENEFFRLAR